MKKFSGTALLCAISSILNLPVGLSAQPLWGSSPIAEPYPYVADGGLTGPAVPDSPDPLVAYRWPSPKADDNLEIYLIKPKAVTTDKPASFDNVQSLTGSSPNVTVKGTGSIRVDFGLEHAAWVEFDSPDLIGNVVMSISEHNVAAPAKSQDGRLLNKTMTPIRHGNTYRLEMNSELYDGVRLSALVEQGDRHQ